ncbi:unnamed protein product [Didymodactylos carnosus]|uniref:Enkurin domain-containing protein n=2 Tax=Didymodactylos carnosus TaxID=1234261 RepID=A0A814XWD0_9BILA|nr:unnamed protein product [Didymodactylos carnosus]CAF3984560.1 unnamed protein product [Didymodactylos carnosus]
MALTQQPWSVSFNTSMDNFERRRDETKNMEGRSLLTGPIPPTPGFENDFQIRSTPTSARGIRVSGVDAKAIYNRSVQGSGVPFLFKVQDNGLSRFGSGTKTKPIKNHMAENMKRIRHAMRQSKMRENEKEQQKPVPVKALWQSQQWKHVQSKVKENLENQEKSVSRPQSANYLKPHENTGPHFRRPQSVSNSRRNSIASEVDASNTNSNCRKDDGKLDYVKLNTLWAKNVPKVRKSTSEEVVQQTQEKKQKEFQDYKQNQKGKVPDYIDRIREERDQERTDQSRNAPDPECPKGHVKVQEDERRRTLQTLQLNQKDLVQRLGHLPIRNDSVTLRKTKEDLEKKIIELDEAIKIFSKPKVFIKIDE